MTKEVGAVRGGERVQGLGSGAAQAGEAALGALAQEGFEFGEGLFDGVEVRAIGGEIKQAGSARCHGLAHAANLVRGEIVANDEVAGTQFWREDFPHVRQEHVAIHRSIKQQWSGEAVVAQGGDEGGRAPVTVRHRAQAALGAPGAPVEARHLGVEPRFIKEDEAGDGPAWLLALPLLAGQCDVGPALFRGAQRFFYSSSQGARVGARGR